MPRVLRLIAHEAAEWFRALLRGVPGEIGCVLRRHLYGFQGASRVRVLAGVRIYHPRKLRIGPRSAITADCQLNAGGEIEIGSDVLVGPAVTIWSQNHKYRDVEARIREQGYECEKVTIEDDVWIGARAIILPGVTLRHGTVVAAGAVVTKSTEPFSLVAGVPARPIGKRESRPECDGVGVLIV